MIRSKRKRKKNYALTFPEIIWPFYEEILVKKHKFNCKLQLNNTFYKVSNVKHISSYKMYKKLLHNTDIIGPIGWIGDLKL